MTSPPLQRLPYSVVHYGKNDPERHVGGVETFARSLQLAFRDVQFATPGSIDLDYVRTQRLPVVCDNHWVLDWPEDIPVIGFQHGVASVKRRATGNWSDFQLARRQKKAARRRNTLWVACAQWIARTFEEHYGNGARHVIYHIVDLERFSGRLDNAGSRLVLHDARSSLKGSRQIAQLQRAFPEWRFEPLACQPHEVPERMSKAAAFVHLSKYEGNSIVCNEAMAQNLPCLFTRVGLMQDASGPSQVATIDPETAFRNASALRQAVAEFLGSLASRTYSPRQWVLENASLEKNLAAWARVMDDFKRMPWGDGR